MGDLSNQLNSGLLHPHKNCAPADAFFALPKGNISREEVTESMMALCRMIEQNDHVFFNIPLYQKKAFENKLGSDAKKLFTILTKLRTSLEFN